MNLIEKFSAAGLVGAAAVVVGCGKTPVEAILTVADGSSCALSGEAITAGIQARLRAVATGRCLSAGQPIMVLGTPALATTMLDDCAQADIWQLQRAMTLSRFVLFDTSVQRNLDIEMGGMTDGTRAILYSTLGIRNQQFGFEERQAGVFRIAPVHVETSCLADVAPSPEIFGCDPEADEQEWQFIADVCP